MVGYLLYGLRLLFLSCIIRVSTCCTHPFDVTQGLQTKEARRRQAGSSRSSGDGAAMGFCGRGRWWEAETISLVVFILLGSCSCDATGNKNYINPYMKIIQLCKISAKFNSSGKIFKSNI